MIIQWEPDQHTGGKTAQIGPYDVEIIPEGYGWLWYVYIGDEIGDEGESLTDDDAEAAILGYIRKETAELAESLGLIPPAEGDKESSNEKR